LEEDILPILDEKESDSADKARAIQNKSICTPPLEQEKLVKKGNLIPDDVSLNEDDDATM
jgi:hypothetical protein